MSTIEYWKKVFHESDKIVQEIDELRLKPKSTEQDLTRLRGLRERLSTLKESVRPKEPAYQRVMHKYFEDIFAGGINVKRNRCAVSEAIRLTPMQRFLKKYFSEESDVSGLLLFHGIGVGKTCTAISIAEELANEGRKVIVLTKHSLINQFMDEIFDAKTVAFKENGQLDIEASAVGKCTGTAYLKSLSGIDKTIIKQRVESRIKSRYEIDSFHGILKTLNEIKSDVQRVASPGTAAFEMMVDERVRETFSDTLMIIDEIHNLRDKEHSEEFEKSKAISNAVFHVARCTVNMKLLILTATPMFNETVDAIWILNLLRINDGLRAIKDEEVFESDGRTVSESGARLLADALQGFVSYAPPGTEEDTELYPRVKYIKNSSRSNAFEHRAKGLQLEMIKKIPVNDSTLAQNVANVCVPTPKGYFEEAFDTVTEKGNKHRFRYRKNVKRFLGPDLIGEHAVKIASIVEHARNAKGIVFVYSNLLNTGLVSVAIALEQAGFTRRAGSASLLIDPNQKRGGDGHRYALLCGRNEISDDSKSTLSILRSPENKDGKNIKVLLGSDVMAEGIDLKNVREVHILEPWWHLNKIKQCIGRAVRRCSHVDLPESERTVDIYLHAVSESIDVKKYKVSNSKGDAMAAVEGILKENAIDACLFDHRATGCSIGESNRETHAFTLHEYEDVVLPAIDEYLESRKRIVVALSSVADMLRSKYFSKSKVPHDALMNAVHDLLVERPNDRYVSEIRRFVPHAEYRYMQMRERMAAIMRPSCIKKKMFFDKASKGQHEEAYHEFSSAFLNYGKLDHDAILESIRLQAVRLKTDIRATLSPSVSEHTVNRLSNVFVDYAVDRLTPSELLCFYSIFMKPGLKKTKSIADILRSMTDAGYVIVDDNGECVYGFDYFNNVYYKRGDRGLEKADFYELSSRDLKKNKPDDRNDNLVVKGGMEYVGPNIPYEFKTSKIGFDGGWTRGMVCSSSVHDKDKLVDNIASISTSRLQSQDIDKSKASKGLLCIMIELFLRLEGGSAFSRCSAKS